MKSSLALVALAAGISHVTATGFHDAPSYSCPDNQDNQCTSDMTKGFDWSDLNIGSFDTYKGFQYSGYTCSQKFGKRDSLTGRSFQSKCITGKATQDKDSSPKISCDKSQGVDKTSISEFQVTPEFDCDLEFHYTMPDGSTCKQRSSCQASGTTVKNTQCGGATDVTVVYPSQPDKGKDSCDYGIHSIGFDCEGAQPTTTKTHTYAVSTPTYPVNTYPVGSSTAPASSPSSYPVGSASYPVGSPSSTPSYPVGSPSYSVGTPSSSPTYPVSTASIPVESTPAESTPAQSTPAESTPAESTPAQSTPAESSTIGSSSTAAVSSPSVTPSSASVPGSYPVYTPSSTSVPVESTPESTPAQSTPAESTPAESTPAESTPAHPLLLRALPLNLPRLNLHLRSLPLLSLLLSVAARRLLCPLLLRARLTQSRATLPPLPFSALLSRPSPAVPLRSPTALLVLPRSPQSSFLSPPLFALSLRL
ncbi:hypothetical protein F5Y03DRAFT_122825 [Xylaria venustula]|nr:hypothetical protein F5Y03DRAFT_122825 [Xylaria venustula]